MFGAGTNIARLGAGTILLAIALAGCGGGDASEWTRANHDLGSTRTASSSSIDSETVTSLRPIWRHAVAIDPPDSSGSLTATPVVADETVYVQDMRSNVYALRLDDGRLRWRHDIGFRNPGPNGLAIEDDRVYGVTDESVFALDAADGRPVWSRRILTDVEYFVDIAPQVAGDRVFASTVGFAPRGRGALYALDRHTGRTIWRFDTIKDPWRYPLEAGGGGAWNTPSVDGDDVFWGISNPTPWGGTRKRPNGGSFPGPALYTDSLVVTDAKTGALRWHDQVTPHDIRDYDFHLPPVLGDADGEAAVFGAGKAGVVIAWSRESRTRLWETQVGVHRNDHGPLPHELVDVCPGLYGGVETPMALAGGRLFVPVVNLCSLGSATGYEPLENVDPNDGTGLLVALDPSDGSVAWQRRLPLPVFGCATVANDVVFTSTFDGTIHALHVEDGRTLWTGRTRAGINACPAVVGDTLVVAAGIGRRAEIVAFATRR